MINEDEILIYLKKLIIQYYGDQIFSKNSKIQDFHAINEDNEGFLNDFFEHFKIVDKDFEFYDYFYEQEFITLNIIRDIISVFGISKQKKPLYLKNLIKAAQTGHWQDEDANK